MKAHTLADLIPAMTEAEYVELRESIKAQGQLEPITIYDNLILDGRHRYRACRELGVEPKFSNFYDGGDDDAALQFVLGKNLHRRHLNESQRAMIAAEIAKLERGSNQHRKEDAPNGAPSQDAAAKLLKVSRRNVQRAKVVKEKGTPELAKAVTDGKIKVSAAAKIATRPAEEQKKLANEKNTAKRRELVSEAKKAAAPAVKADRATLDAAAEAFIGVAKHFGAPERVSALRYIIKELVGRMPDTVSIPLDFGTSGPAAPSSTPDTPSWPCQCDYRGLEKIACVALEYIHLVSRTSDDPVRRPRIPHVQADRVDEALAMLVERGLVEKVPRRGHQITEAGKQVHAAKFEAARANAEARRAAWQQRGERA
jgi:ParB-like chromosome segregation protein Spo0J